MGATIVRPRGTEWLWLTGVAANGLVLFNIAVIRGVAHAEPAVVAVSLSCAPILIALVGAFLEGRVPHSRTVAAAMIVAGGSVLVAGFGACDGVGLFWAFMALVSEAPFTLLAVPVLSRHAALGVSIHSI